MKLEQLYRLSFVYPESYGGGEDRLLLAEGRAEGRLSGRFRGANRAWRRTDRTWLPAVEGAVVTDDDATVLLRLTGYGRPHEEPSGRVVAAITHATDDERYSWLAGTLGVVAGEVRDGREVVLEVAALVWEPPEESPRYDLRQG